LVPHLADFLAETPDAPDDAFPPFRISPAGYRPQRVDWERQRLAEHGVDIISRLDQLAGLVAP
jgi:hypothetical protein